MKATVKAPGTCGELVQGTINGCNFHVTCPINRYSYVTVELTPRERSNGDCNSALSKTLQAVNRTLDYFSVTDLNAVINVDSELINGKGMASSTADITAAILATAVALDKKITPREIAKLSLGIEPTDGVFYEGIVLFDHIKGRIYESLGKISGLNILMLDLGGKVDTLEFNNRADLSELNRLNEPLTGQALEMVKRGIKQRDLQLVGQGATLSSRANQKILPKQYFEEFLQLTELEGVMGINVAHSGSLIGVLYDEERIEVKEIEFKIKQKTTGLKMDRLKLINGGLEVVDSSLSWERKYQYG